MTRGAKYVFPYAGIIRQVQRVGLFKSLSAVTWAPRFHLSRKLYYTDILKTSITRYYFGPFYSRTFWQVA